MSAHAVQIAVARADLILCQIAALPWKKIGLSLLIAAAMCYIVRKVVKDRWSG